MKTIFWIIFIAGMIILAGTGHDPLPLTTLKLLSVLAAGYIADKIINSFFI